MHISMLRDMHHGYVSHITAPPPICAECAREQPTAFTYLMHCIQPIVASNINDVV